MAEIADHWPCADEEKKKKNKEALHIAMKEMKYEFVHTRGELFTLTGIIRTNSVRIYEQELLQH